LDLNAYNAGLKAGISGKAGRLSNQKIGQVLMAYQTQLQTKMRAGMKKASASNAQAGKVFLANNKSKAGVHTLKNGLQYKIIKAGTGPRPKASDTVTVDYEGTLITGKVFDSSYKRGTPATFPLKGVIPGWTQALQLMRVGGTWMLYLPANLAYGPSNVPGIGPDQTLIFKVHLISIKK
jgi:FKBP-type peptidyl-prolyl cis-trans isomerase FklB